MKKICVSTYCDWNNYGSILQSLGLKTALNKLEFDSFIIKDKPAPPLKYVTSIKLNKNPKNCIRNIFTFLKSKDISKRYMKTRKFIHNSIDILYYNDYTSILKKPPKADYYIAGSDQIWNPKSSHPVFFLDFLEDKVKRISYAASMGNTNIPEDKKKTFIDMVKKFDYISVREEDNANIINKYVDKDVQINIDPAFLISAEEWRSLQKPYNIKKPYVLVYTIYWDKSLNKQIKEIHKKTGYDVLAICGGISRIWANKKLFDVDPGEFLWLIDNAQAVISSSFHGVAFSIIFNKKLSAIINPVLPSRITNLLNKLSVKNSEIKDVLEVNLDFYNVTNKKILEEKDYAIDYLKKVLDVNE